MNNHEQKSKKEGNEVYEELDKHVTRRFPDQIISKRPSNDLELLSKLPRISYYHVMPSDKFRLHCTISRGAWEVVHDDMQSMEFVVLSPGFSDDISLLLDQVIYYHSFQKGQLRIGDTVPIGRPWLPGSHCDVLLVSHPYPLGKAFEHCATDDISITMAWLLPITIAERDYKAQNGLESLELLFEKVKIQYWNPSRTSIV